MDIKLSLSEYTSILGGMKHDVRQAFVQHFNEPANTYPNVNLDSPSDQKHGILHLETVTKSIKVDLVLPFTVEPGGYRIVRADGARLEMTINTRESTLDKWSRDTNVGEQGKVFIGLKSMDEEPANEAGKAAADFVANLLVQELEPA